MGEDRAEGLAEVIEGSMSLEQAIRTADGGFDYVGVGQTPANPAGIHRQRRGCTSCSRGCGRATT